MNKLICRKGRINNWSFSSSVIKSLVSPSSALSETEKRKPYTHLYTGRTLCYPQRVTSLRYSQIPVACAWFWYSLHWFGACQSKHGSIRGQVSSTLLDELTRQLNLTKSSWRLRTVVSPCWLLLCLASLCCASRHLQEVPWSVVCSALIKHQDSCSNI